MSQSATLGGVEKAHRAAAAASEGKAENIVIIDLRGISTVTDYFVLLTGSGMTHLKALGKRIEDSLTAVGIKAGNIDGGRGTGWMVFDYGNVIVHAMTDEIRQRYDLERLWGDAPRVEWS